MTSERLVKIYKSLSGVEWAFRSFKTVFLKVRSIVHHLEEMVRAHIFLCMLAYHLQWHLEKKLEAALFHDEQPGGAPRENPVAKARRSERAERKVASKKTENRPDRAQPCSRTSPRFASLRCARPSMGRTPSRSSPSPRPFKPESSAFSASIPERFPTRVASNTPDRFF